MNSTWSCGCGLSLKGCAYESKWAPNTMPTKSYAFHEKNICFSDHKYGDRFLAHRVQALKAILIRFEMSTYHLTNINN